MNSLFFIGLLSAAIFFVGLLSAAIFFFSDPVLLVDIARQDSAFTICSVVEPEGLVVWGEPGTLGTSFGQLWTAAERAVW
jgi:hypothetical protein